MKQVLVRRGVVVLEEVPSPGVESGRVLVQVAYSVISTGTEVSNVERSGKSLVRRALEQPEQVRQVLDSLRRQGVYKTTAKIRGKLDAGTPAGYSCSGIAIAVGEGVEGIAIGDPVACAGAGHANHAEIVSVPRNLVTRVPDGCDLRSAASVTLGAIAMQGVRRADPKLGETVVVIGLGLLGQITVQLLAASGCRVLGVDLDEHRVALARSLGAAATFNSGACDVRAEIAQFTAMRGADAVIITASTSSDAVVQQAMEITRKRGRVVVVGAVGLGLRRSPFYEKEIDFLISCSYGPGRYDERYEEAGQDYPFGYVRWTENRNMESYLRLIADGKVRLDSILERDYDISEAPRAYTDLKGEGVRPLGSVLCYPPSRDVASSDKQGARVELHATPARDRIGLAVIGAGAFARGTHLPNLAQLTQLFHLRAVVSATGSNAQSAAQQFGADYATTEIADVLADPEVDAVVIATRHHLHAEEVIAALRAGKHVFCEKPLTLIDEEIETILGCYGVTASDAGAIEQLSRGGDHPVLTVGFNRRFSPAGERVRQIAAARANPLVALYRVNAGYIPPENWIQGPEGGGRIRGEMCHLFDLLSYWVGAPVVSINVESLHPSSAHLMRSDNLTVTLSYADGSLATVLYTALGASGLGKEYAEVYVDGKVAVLDDFRKLQVHGAPRSDWSSPAIDKGHRQALQAFGKAIKERGAWPIPLASLIETTRVSNLATATIARPEYRESTAEE